MSKILILGSNSFSGNQMANFLIKKKLKVIGCSQSTEPPIKFNIILNIYHNLLEYKRSNAGNLSMQSLIFLENLIGDIQYKIDQLLFITVPYDENNEETTYWNASKNHRHHFDFDYDENINRSSVFYKDKYDKVQKKYIKNIGKSLFNPYGDSDIVQSNNNTAKLYIEIHIVLTQYYK